MIVSVKPSGPASRRRSRDGFTLVEVLVVVAIVVILASVGTIATIKYLEDAKVDTARAKAAQLELYLKSWSAKNEGTELDPSNISVLAEYAEDGQRALLDPWLNQFQLEYLNDPAQPQFRRAFFYTIPPNGVDGKQGWKAGAPKQLEGLANGVQ